MMTYTVAFALSALVALILTPLMRFLAYRFGLVDEPSESRKVHETPVPRIGGIAIAVAFFVPVLGLYFIDNQVSQSYLASHTLVTGLIIGSMAMIALGLADDIAGVGAKKKFVFQTVVAICAYALGYKISFIMVPFGGGIIELGLLSFPLTLLWIVGIVNAINLIDGLDGLAGGVSLFTVLTLFIIAVMQHNIIVGLTSIALAGALVGFLRYNFNPASIFMGDSGSLFLGYVLAITSISGASKSSTVVSLTIPILALGLPILDTGISVLRRLLSGKPIFSADRGHIHHKLLDLGLTHRQVVMAMYGFCILLGCGALTMVYASSQQAAFILGALGLAVIVLTKILGYLNWSDVSHSVKYGLIRQQRLKRHLTSLEQAVQEIGVAASGEEICSMLEELGDGVQLDVIRMQTVITGGNEPRRCTASWERNSAADGQEDRHTEGERPIHLLEYPMDWRLDGLQITGQISFIWFCQEEVIQLPERVCYQLVARSVRDRLLELEQQGARIDLGPRLVKQP